MKSTNKFKLTPEIRKYIDKLSETLPITPVLIPNPKGMLFIPQINGKPRLMNHNVNLTQSYMKIGDKCFSGYQQHLNFIQTILKNYDQSSK